MMVDGGIFSRSSKRDQFFLGDHFQAAKSYGYNFEGFPEHIFVHCLGWCHIMTPVSLAEFWKKRLEF